jgi:uncharacterized repeat protein (TIGR03803 family)
VLYGTTQAGGPSGSTGYGTVFKITPSGKESVLYNFQGGTDGNAPVAGLTNVGGTLYGTTSSGGTTGNGTVFKITTAGTKSVLYSFAGGSDAAYPTGALLKVGSTLYGTTQYGGASSWGTVFKITTSGSGYKVLYSFNRGSDGANPFAGLIDVSGTLYGTTQAGGPSGNGCGGVGCGTVFKITKSGTESLVHSFTGPPADGGAASGGLTDVGGTLYGTAYYGGASYYGMVFKITTSGSESVLYSFQWGTDGAYPFAGLIDVGGTLYGTTVGGGGAGCACGTVFSISP